jgi:uncharacterized OB-fold protein
MAAADVLPPPAGLPTPAPPVNPETGEFWAAAAQGRLLVKRCEDCQGLIWYPGAICPDCGSMRTQWLQVSGLGRVYSYTINHRGEGAYAGAPPYVLAYVQLDEGPKVMTNIVGTEDAELAIGAQVQVVFHDTGEGTALPRFRLVPP